MKNQKSNKHLTLDKLSISKLTNPQSIIGGTHGVHGGGDGTEDRMTQKKKK